MFARFSAITIVDRQAALMAVKSAISKTGGRISGHSFFSSTAATVTFEIPANRVEELAAILSAEGVNVSIESSPSPSKEEIKATLAITFISDEPEIRREVPAFG